LKGQKRKTSQNLIAKSMSDQKLPKITRVCLVKKRCQRLYFVSYGRCLTKCHHTGLPGFLKSPSSKPSTLKVLSLESHRSKAISTFEMRRKEEPSLHVRNLQITPNSAKKEQPLGGIQLK